MPEYRIVSEPISAQQKLANSTQRAQRGDPAIDRTIQKVSAPNIYTAMMMAVEGGQHKGSSIISLEELLPAEAVFYSDDQLADALMRADVDKNDTEVTERLYPEDYTEVVIYDTPSFNDTVSTVIDILRDTLVPGLHLTLSESEEGNWAMLEVRDDATGIYLATSAATKDLIDDRGAVGFDGLISIARAVINRAAPLL